MVCVRLMAGNVERRVYAIYIFIVEPVGFTDRQHAREELKEINL